MCGHVFLIGAVLVVGYIFGKGWDWRYRIIQKRSSWFDVHYKPSWWPFWFDQGPCYGSIEEAKEGLEFFKKSSNYIQVD
jgi:hypothetical protein